MGTERGRGCRRRTAVGAVGAALGFAVALLPAPAGAATRLELVVGYAGAFVPGRLLPVSAEVTADRLVAGRLEVQITGQAGGGTTVELPVEVPGGSTKRFVTVIPAPVDTGTLTVSVALSSSGEVVAAGEKEARWAADEELVGVLPGLLAGGRPPATAPLAVDAGTARFVAVGEAELAQAPASIDTLTVLAADGRGLQRLPDAQRAGVLEWIAAGGHLLVDSGAGDTVAGLPDAWQPRADGRATAGLGEVRSTSGAMAAGRWAGLVEPTHRLLSTTARGEVGLGGPGNLAAALASDAGLRTARPGWILGFLLLYVGLAGPATFAFLRQRRRLELAWVVVPVLAVGFTGASYILGRGLRAGTVVSHATVLQQGPSGTRALTVLGITARSGGTAKVAFPGGWMPASNGGEHLGQASARVSASLAPDRTEVRLPLDTGQFALLAGTGKVATTGRLEVVGSVSSDGTASGTVRNTTPWRLDDVAVFAGEGGASIGSLEAGEEQRYAVSTDPLDRSATLRMWGSGAAELPGSEQGSPASFALWQVAEAMTGGNLRAPGAVVAAGWTRDYSPPLGVDGSHRASGRTVVVARAPLEVKAAPVNGQAVRRDVVRLSGLPGVDLGRDGSGATMRFVLPDTDSGAPALDPTRLVLSVPVATRVVEVWAGGAWSIVRNTREQSLKEGLDADDVRRRAQGVPVADVALPPGAVNNGAVFVRVSWHGPPLFAWAGAPTLGEIPT